VAWLQARALMFTMWEGDGLRLVFGERRGTVFMWSSPLMTLNFVVVSPKHVYQCSDFRLTYNDQRRTDHEAQKIIAISSLASEWSALIQFTGVGKKGRFDTSEWLANWGFRIPSMGRLPLNSLVQKLLLEAEKYIGNSIDHTFTLVGFEKSRPFTYVVSNFQRLPDTRARVPKRKWEATKTLGRHLVIATGSTDHLDSNDLRALGKLAHRLPPKVAHQKLAELNRAVAMRAGPDSAISQSSMTGHLGLDGQGWLIPHEVNPGGEYLPQFAMKMVPGGRLTPKTDENGKQLPRRLVQVAFKQQAGMFVMMGEFCAAPIEVAPSTLTNPLGRYSA
jgi:hypothetical protein